MSRVVEMVYPLGWVENYHYDAIGQLLKVEDTDPTQKDMKQQKHVYEYDPCGNMTYEYMRGNGTGEATVENFYTYDELHRVVYAKENYGNASRTYQYDSLGNLTWETNSNNVTVDYILNNLNQITSSTEDGWKTSTAFTYDARGNLIEELYTKNKQVSVLGAYTYDETNKMVKGVNDIGESSEYLYNGLGALVTNTWIIKKNAYGYHDVQIDAVVEGETVVDTTTNTKTKKAKKSAEEVAASEELNKSSTVVKEFVVDYNTETFEPLMEHEVNGLDYKYVYGNDRLSVDITSVTNSMSIVENGDHIRLYYHMDYLGTADYLTSPVSLKVTSWTHYNEWGEITHNAVLKCGQRELNLVKRYATHDYDNVLDLYYAKARFYDADNRRFVAVDPILDPSQYDIREYVDDPMQMVQYLYVSNRPLTYIDPDGRMNVQMLNQIKRAHMLGVIPDDWVGTVVILANLYDIATAVSRMLTNPGKYFFDTFFVDIEEDINESGNASLSSLYLSFHETAQVLASKPIWAKNVASGYVYASMFESVELEKRDFFAFKNKEADITYGTWLWEVKPDYNNSWLSSLKKYIPNMNYKDSSKFANSKYQPGYYFLGTPITDNDVFERTYVMYDAPDHTVYIHLIDRGLGRIGYYFTFDCTSPVPVTSPEYKKAKDAATDLQPLFEVAHSVQYASAFGMLAGAALMSIVSPVLGDEIAVGGLITQATTKVAEFLSGVSIPGALQAWQSLVSPLFAY